MLRQFGEVIEVKPRENAFTVWGGTRQSTRMRAYGHDDGLGFDALFFAVAMGGDHVVVAVESTRTLNDSHALRG